MDYVTSHTAGPWSWFGNANSNSLYLATRDRGRRYVMGFKRWGFSGAQPQFQPANRGLVDASALLQFEVGDRDVVGVEQAKANTSVYRMDVCGIDNSDARLLAGSPLLMEAAVEILNNMSSTFIAKNGRQVGIQADDGEKVWLVHSDLIFALQSAVEKAGATANTAIAQVPA